MKAVPTLGAPGAAATKGGTHTPPHGSQQGPVDAGSPPLSTPAAPTNVSKPLSSPAAPINVSKPVVEKAAASPKKATTLKEKPAVVKRVSLKWSEVEEKALLEGIEQHSNIDGKGGVRISWTG